MATSSLLDLDMHRLLRKAESLTGTKLPREVVEVTLDPELNTLCIRFKRSVGGELGEPAYPRIHLFKDKSTNEITALELIEMDEFLKES